MIINKIKLENIRSYLNQEIVFPEGTVLLSGDIGSGKSTVLLATEFALFGLEKGSGQGLLRNGKDSGSVELHLNLDEKEVIIKRNLKRSSKSVKQEAGYILIEGRKEEGTATELKAKILDLLKYPKDYLTRNKGLLYKYTVYTPQEEMKRILLESKEDRLHVLRKIFDIDKYKRIQENCVLFLKHLRSEGRVYEERLKDIDVKLNEKEKKEKELLEIKKEYEEIEKELSEVKEEVLEKKKNVEEFESKVKELNELKNKLSLIENNYNYKLSEKNKTESKIKELREEIIDEKDINFDDLKKEYDFKIDVLRKNIYEIEDNLEDVRNKLSGFRVKENHACEIKDSIKDLDKCPTCFQEVSKNYKDNIFKTQDELIKRIKSEVDNLLKIEEKYKVSLLSNREKLEDLNKKSNNIEINKIKFDNNKKKKEELVKNEQELEKLKVDVDTIFRERERIAKELEKNKGLEEEFRGIKLEFEAISRKEREIEIRKTGVNERINFANQIINKLSDDIKKLEELKIKLSKLKEIETWLDKSFVNLMTSIEKNVMYKLHSEFDELFKKWFAIIIDNENLKVELDEEFTPKIIQADYDINYNDLSGGEKTSVALAYRLSLNQVLNNISGEIKTKDLLILDEPTDGFSTEQLDRVRVVLDELNMKQIIIVSHEAKIESFVDKVLKFNKKEHVSEVS